MMNSFIKTLTRRITGTVAGLHKFYHNSPRIYNAGHDIVATFQNEQNICRLVQKTIIPLNIIKPKPPILDLPCTNNFVGRLDYSLPEKIDREPEKQIIEPTSSIKQEKKAHRMLIIRRKKMNKHRYKKRLRKLKFFLAKIKRERRMSKEVVFRQEISNQLKEAQKFDAKEHVAAKLEMYRRKLLPSRLHGKLMPSFVIEEHIEKRKAKIQHIAEIKARRERFRAERGGTLDVDIKS